MVKVSIIIPIFNASKFLEKSIASITNQTLQNIEIICVNDGSKDNSLQILQSLAEKDSRIKIIDFKENQGVSNARNTGIKNANGEFVGFIDADDYVDIDFYEKLYNAAITEKADIARANGKIISIDGSESIIKDSDAPLLPKAKISFKTMFTLGIYKTEFLKANKINFPLKYKNGEDFLFLVKSILIANKVTAGIDSFYYYIKRQDSASNTGFNSYDSFKWYLKAICDILMLVNNSNFAQEDKAVITNIFISIIFSDFFKAEKTIQEQIIKDLLTIFEYVAKTSQDDIIQKIYNDLKVNNINNLEKHFKSLQNQIMIKDLRNKMILKRNK